MSLTAEKMVSFKTPNPHPPGRGSFRGHVEGREEEGRSKGAGREEGGRRKGRKGGEREE